MICECGGILEVIRVEKYPKATINKINYDRLCDVKCLKCEKTLYSQPYDFGKILNDVKDLSEE